MEKKKKRKKRRRRFFPIRSSTLGLLGLSVALIHLAYPTMSHPPVTNMSQKSDFNSHSSSTLELRAQESHPLVLYTVGAPTRSKRSPKIWGRKAWISALNMAVSIIAAAVLGVVLGSRANRYPSYSKLHYSIFDICEHQFSLS